MQSNQAWIAMFRRIPADLEDTLALGLTTGAEIVVQKVIKLEPDFMIVRGRVAGTQDNGRIVLVPYGELAYVAIQRFLKDPEVEAIFGKGAPASVVSLPAESARAEPSLPADDSAPKEPPAAKPPEQVSKAMLLAKLRDRLKDAGQAGK
jgi:hypothetical protein